MHFLVSRLIKPTNRQPPDELLHALPWNLPDGGVRVEVGSRSTCARASSSKGTQLKLHCGPWLLYLGQQLWLVELLQLLLFSDALLELADIELEPLDLVGFSCVLNRFLHLTLRCALQRAAASG